MIGQGRLRRLYNDYDQMQAMHNQNGLIYIVAKDGDPPERYLVGFRCIGVTKIDSADTPVLRQDHRVELVLTAEYPRFRPLMRWQTPIFHPNFNDQGDVCLKEWYPQQTLRELCEVLAELVQYKNYNTTSPLNMEAAMWAMRHRAELPIDNRALYTQVNPHVSPTPIAQSVPAAQAVVREFKPFWSPPAEAETRPKIKLARFCSQCGFEFEAAEIRSCPQCGVERVAL